MSLPRANIVIISLLFLSTFGCRSVDKSTEVEKFQRGHNSQAAHYTHIYPIALDTYAILIGTYEAQIDIMLDALPSRVNSDVQWREHVKQLRENAKEQIKVTRQYFKELQQLATRDHVICQFEWRDGNHIEIGILALHGGRIVRRDVWLWDKTPLNDTLIK